MDYCESVVTGMRNGPVFLRYASGLVLYQGQYRDGRPDGRWVGWHFNGRRAGEADFVGGALTGVAAWYDDGELAFQAVPPVESFSIPKRLTADDPTAFVELVFLLRGGASR